MSSSHWPQHAIGTRISMQKDATPLGTIGGGLKCRMSSLRNGHVHWHYFCNFHIEFKMVPCHRLILRNTLFRPIYRMSIFRHGHVPWHYFRSFYVEFKMVPCHRSILRDTLCSVFYCGSKFLRTPLRQGKTFHCAPTPPPS